MAFMGGTGQAYHQPPCSQHPSLHVATYMHGRTYKEHIAPPLYGQEALLQADTARGGLGPLPRTPHPPQHSRSPFLTNDTCAHRHAHFGSLHLPALPEEEKATSYVQHTLDHQGDIHDVPVLHPHQETNGNEAQCTQQRPQEGCTQQAYTGCRHLRQVGCVWVQGLCVSQQSGVAVHMKTCVTWGVKVRGCIIG